MLKIFRMSDKVYDILKKIAMPWLPAIGTLYFALAGIWNLPYAEQIVGTCTALETFLCTVLRISSYEYHKEQERDFDDGDQE